ncbi:glycerophosphodiester phosphodiesterase [soil metagenome]
MPAASIPSPGLATSSSGVRPAGRPVAIAHRGASWSAPEHTFAAYDLALHQRADYLEIDLQMTRDGVLVALHDPTLGRTADFGGKGCQGLVRARSLADLAGCEFGGWFNDTFPGRARPEFAGQPLPTLDAVMSRYGETTRYYVEMKQPESNPGMEAALVRQIRKHGLYTAAVREWGVLIESFSATSLRLTHRIEPELPLIQLLPVVGSAAAQGHLAEIARYAVGVGVVHRDVDDALVAAVHRHGLVVHAYTVNDESEMERLLKLGVEGIFTDRPDRLTELRDWRHLTGHAAA